MTEIGMGAAGRQGYQAGYDDGLSEGERRGWEKAAKIADEAATEALRRTSDDKEALGKDYDPNSYGAGAGMGAFEEAQNIAAAIRKLKKP